MIKAEVAQLVELQPSKLEVAGSRPVFRSEKREMSLKAVLNRIPRKRGKIRV